MFKNFKRHGHRNEDKFRVENFRNECNLAVQAAKDKYLEDLGRKLNDPRTNQKSHWEINNKLLNKKVPNIPPLLMNNKFIVNCKAKAVAFNNYFATQCPLPTTVFYQRSIIWHLPG